MEEAGRLRRLIHRSQQRLRQAMKDRQGLLTDGSSADIFCSVKDAMNRYPSEISAITAQGAKSGQQEAVVRNVRSILQSEMLETGRQFGKLVERRSQEVKKVEDRKQVLDAVGDGGVRNRAMFKRNVEARQRNDDDDKSKLMDSQLMADDQESKERVAKARKINDMLTDVMSAFQRMTAIVSMQENRLESIDRDTRQAETNIKKGRKEVESIYEDVSSKRSLIIKIFATILVFSIIYIVFLL